MYCRMVGRKAASKRLLLKNKTALAKRSKNKRGRLQSWKEERMHMAVAEFFDKCDNPHALSIRSLARAYQVPASTLSDRTKLNPATVIIKPKLGRKTIFNDQQEEELATLLRDMAKRGFGLTRLDVRRLAYEYAESKNVKGFSEKTKRAGYDWFQAFMERQKGLSVRKTENLSLNRAMNLNETTVKKHFDGLLEVMNDNDIIDHPERIWNTDETGLQDVFESGDVVASSKGRLFNITGRERGETTTLLSAVNAAGEIAPHLIIFKGKRQRPELQEKMAIGDLLRMSDSGWIKDSLITEWGYNFIRFLRLKASLDKKHLLILDGHTTHSLNLEFIETMKKNNIILWCIPAHTSHVLQPLDKNVFSSLKTAWNRLGTQKTQCWWTAIKQGRENFIDLPSIAHCIYN